MYPKHGDLQGSRNYWYFQEGYCQLVLHINSIHPSILVGPCSMYLGIKTVRPSLAWSRSKATSIPGSKPTPSPISQDALSLERKRGSWTLRGPARGERPAPPKSIPLSWLLKALAGVSWRSCCRCCTGLGAMWKLPWTERRGGESSRLAVHLLDAEQKNIWGCCSDHLTLPRYQSILTSI